MIESSLLLRTLAETPDNEYMIRGLPDLKCGVVKTEEYPNNISVMVLL
jgi:hypothetical protein